MGSESKCHVFLSHSLLMFNYIVANGREEVPVRHRRLYVVKWQRGWGSWECPWGRAAEQRILVSGFGRFIMLLSAVLAI